MSNRRFAPTRRMLVSQALRDKDVTYLNVSSAPHTRPIIEAQGFSRYSDGIFIAVPMFDGPVRRPESRSVRCAAAAGGRFRLRRCRRFCCSMPRMAASACGAPHPSAPIRLCSVRAWCRGLIPCAQLIYCRDIGDFVRFAGPIGRLLARRGRPFVIIDANAPIPGLLGWFSRGNMPKYFKGPRRPRLGDLAYTEHAVLGV